MNNQDAFNEWKKDTALSRGIRTAPPFKHRSRFNVASDICRDSTLTPASRTLLMVIYSRIPASLARCAISRKWLMQTSGLRSKSTFYKHRDELVQSGWLRTFERVSGNGAEASLYEFIDKRFTVVHGDFQQSQPQPRNEARNG